MRFNLILNENGDKTIVQFMVRCNDTQSLFTFSCDNTAIEDLQHCLVNATTETYKYKKKLRDREMEEFDGILEAY